MTSETSASRKSLAAKDSTEEQRREAASVMGSARTERKVSAALSNLEKRGPDQLGGRPTKALSDIPCSCEAGEALDGHRWNCPRGQAIKRRRAKGELTELTELMRQEAAS